MMSHVAVSLASRVAETLVFGEMSNGHGGDGPAATSMAERMVKLGHGFNFKHEPTEEQPETYALSGQISFSDIRSDEEFHEQRELLLWEGYKKALDILTAQRPALDALAAALEAEPTLVGDRVHEILEENWT
jgi:ATP-dependent Zn protease